MHIDMHYAGTYAIAKLAGIDDETAKKIATSAQFVDDAAEDIAVLVDGNGKLFSSEISTRYSNPMAYAKTRAFLVSYIDQLNIWVPFHFFPGAKGEELTQKLVCKTDSEPVREMFGKHIEKAVELQVKDISWGPHLVGVAAHVYADTFAHYGFSGVSSRRNLVDADSIEVLESETLNESGLWRGFVEDCRKKWGYKFLNIKVAFENEFGELATTRKVGDGAMGHPGVGKMPDIPYLRYSFQREWKESSSDRQAAELHVNQETYLDACRKMHEFLCRYREEAKLPLDKNTHKEFSSNEVEANIADIFKLRENDEHERVIYWGKQAEKLWGFSIPDYEGETWKNEFSSAKQMKDVIESDAYNFYMAAAWHKKVTLDDILPKYGIDIECRQFRIKSGGFEKQPSPNN